MTTITRRYDIDWLRVIAIGLLLIYHVSIGFQPWGIMIGFITNEQPWESLWIPMAMLNIWRIPLLFFVSGMGVYLTIQTKDWKQLLLERGKRILIPYVFGIIVIVPVSIYLWKRYNNFPPTYDPGPGHLWFLGNIFAYVLLMMPVFFYLKNQPTSRVVRSIQWLFGNPLGLIMVIIAFIGEALIIRPLPYELYAMTAHGFFLGLLAFFFGFCFMLAGNAFREMLTKGWWIFLACAAILYTLRITYFDLRAPVWLLVIESDLWIFSAFALAARYLDRPGKTLSYLSQAAYPVYILHMIFLFLGSSVIFPMAMNVNLKYFIVLAFTVAGCFITYEFLIKRVNALRFLFGLKSCAHQTNEASL